MLDFERDIWPRRAAVAMALRSRWIRDADLEDLVQETMRRALRSLPTYDPEKSSVGTWLSMIARCVAIDHRKRENRRKRSGQPGDDFGLATHPAPRVETAESDNNLNRYLESVPEEFRLMVELFVRGNSYAAISEHLGIPLGTVKSRFNRARLITPRPTESHRSRRKSISASTSASIASEMRSG